MAGPVDSDDDDVIASINMVPFIDICLVLLIIFMVTSSYIVRQAIEVDLPRAASGSSVTPTTVSIEVLRTGVLKLNGVVVTRDELDRGVRAEVTANETVQAIIAGDRNVDYGAVVDVVDIVKLAGVRSFALNIEREERP
jgi:biopolymer transport protein ExbD